MTGIQFDPIGHNAAEAARRAREQATRIAAGPALAAPADTGRMPHRGVRRADAAREAPAPVRAGDAGDPQAAPYERRLQRGPGILFLAQRFAQEDAPQVRLAVSAASVAARYPSLGFRDELILPGEVAAMAEGQPRIDFYA